MSDEETEQELEKEKEEPEEKKELYLKRASKKVYNPLYHEPKFLEKLEQYYVETQNYAVTSRRLNERFKCTVNPTTVRKIYTQRMAYKITHDVNAREFFENSFERMKERWNDAWDMVGDLIKQYKKLKKQIELEDEPKQALMFMKITPQIIGITQEIRKQLQFIHGEQEQIKIQQNTLIFSPLQINQHIGPVIKRLIDEGKLSVNRDMPEFGIEENEKGVKNESKKIKIKSK